MFSKIVVGADDSPGGRDAMAFARTLPVSPGGIVAVDATREEAHALLEAAARAHADLIVVGSSPHGPVGRVLLGDIARGVVHGAPCPVVVVPHGWREHPQPIRWIGVGYVRTPEARAALDIAAQIARAAGASLRVRTAVAVPTPFVPAYAYTYDWDQVEGEHRALAQEDLDEATAGLDVPVTVETTMGSAQLDLAELSEDVDLLAVGCRGWGPGRRIVLGSTSDRLTHHARCPIVVVPSHLVAEEQAA